MEREIEIFNNYYSNFDDNVSDIHRKYEHTFRVVGYAERVARSIGLSEEDVRLACICALFHDLGRFPQWTEYQTYNDKISFDHGDRGYEILKEIGYDDEIVLIAVKEHNKYAVSEGLTDRQKMFADITRDADKLDILISLGFKCDDEKFELEQTTKEDIDNRRLVRNVINETDTFHILRMLSFIFDTVYKESFRIIENEEIINSKFDILASKFGEDTIHEYRLIFDNYVKERID